MKGPSRLLQPKKSHPDCVAQDFLLGYLEKSPKLLPLLPLGRAGGGDWWILEH